MKAHATTFATMLVVAVAIASSTGIRAASAASKDKANTVTGNGFNVPVNHVGPGVGSVKHPPFVHFDSTGIGESGRWYHHGGDRVKTAPSIRQGPGPGSSKTPYAR